MRILYVFVDAEGRLKQQSFSHDEWKNYITDTKFINLITSLQTTDMISTQAIRLSRVTYYGMIYSMLPGDWIICG